MRAVLINTFFLGCVSLFILLCVNFSQAAITYESATIGTTGQTTGAAVYEGQFLGVRFEVNRTWTVETIGGHFHVYGSIFGAVVQLDSLFDFRDSTDLSSSDVLGYALFSQTTASADISAPPEAPITLTPSVYGLVFGDNLWGTNGPGGAAPQNNSDTQ